MDRHEGELGDDAERVVLDGNAIGGLLQQLFGCEMTAAPRRCQTCGQTSEVGRHRLYRGAGMVLRCPNCGDVAAQIAELPDRVVLRLGGAWTLPRQ